MDRNQQEQFKLINNRIDGLNQRINESDEALSQRIDQSSKGNYETGKPKSENNIQQYDVDDMW